MKEVNKVVYDDRVYYHSTEQGKRLFVEERLKPLVMSMDTCWEDIKYVNNSKQEIVKLINKNPEKSVDVNVACDSISALTKDVFRVILETY